MTEKGIHYLFYRRSGYQSQRVTVQEVEKRPSEYQSDSNEEIIKDKLYIFRGNEFEEKISSYCRKEEQGIILTKNKYENTYQPKYIGFQK
jgi:hypothetical protein